MVEGVYFFKATYYGYDDKPHDLKEETHYGFISASGFAAASQEIIEYYREDLISFSLEEIGDTLICVDSKAIAEAFKEAYKKTHYGEKGV